MQPIFAAELLAGLTQVALPGNQKITAVVTDSRKICKDCVFVCFKGQRVDGHDFAPQAIQQGAAYVVVNHLLDTIPTDRQIVCESSHRAMMQMGANYRAKFQPKMIGVTGSVGKTTTKEFCYAVLSAFGNTLKTDGNQNNEIGVPNTLFRLESNTEYAVVEMGMSALGEIERLSRVAKPDAGIITCIGVSHMETLGSQENICKAKLEICAGLPDGAPLALNADDVFLNKARENGEIPQRLQTVWYGLDAEWADVTAINLTGDAESQQFTLVDKENGSFAVTIPALGKHSVYDALAAYAAATRMGLDAKTCAAALANYKSTGMRQNVVKKNGCIFIEDCYNASPDSVKASLQMFRDYPCTGRKFALLGDMLELGDLEEQAHKQVGEWAAQSGLSKVIALGAASKFTVEQAQKNGLDAVHCEGYEQAAQELLQLMQPGDALLAKASRGMKLETVLQTLYEQK